MIVCSEIKILKINTCTYYVATVTRFIVIINDNTCSNFISVWTLSWLNVAYENYSIIRYCAPIKVLPHLSHVGEYEEI